MKPVARAERLSPAYVNYRLLLGLDRVRKFIHHLKHVVIDLDRSLLSLLGLLFNVESIQWKFDDSFFQCWQT